MGGGDCAVLKIANAREQRSVIEAQQRAMTLVATTLDVVPRIITTMDREIVTPIAGEDGREHLVWAITHVAGHPLAEQRRRSPNLLADLGHRIGELTLALARFDHPAIHRDFHWDLARGRAVIDQHRALVTDHTLGALIDALTARFDDHVLPLLPSLRTSALHNDLNDHNVLVGGGTDDFYSRHQRITGIVDFGDMVHGYTVGDLAIAAAYVCISADDPLRAVAAVVRGYHAVFPLKDAEISALFGLIVLRLCTSVVLAAHQRAQNPGNAYLDVSQDAIRRMLPKLEKIPFGLATAVFRGACSLAPVPTSDHVRKWLGANTAKFAPILPVDLRTEPCTVLDLSIGSALVSGDEHQNTEPRLSRRIADALRDDGTFIGVGRYDEPRLLYVAPFFAMGPDARDERRTVHIGLDLFADAGTPVHAPLAGTVHAFADNRIVQDYGPVIVLRHTTDDGVEFFTLYGHLSRESLEGMQIGRTIAKGEAFATLGAPDVNVGWSPHLHLQVITDLLGLGTDYPGVAPASQRGVWRSLCPDPNLIVGVPAHRFPPATPLKRDSVARRRAVIGGNVSIAYRDPIRAARGWKQYLYDDVGRRYLDAYNNVPHVGHSHPRVVDAAARQMSVLNTNTRYLNDRLAEYAERLVATLPAPLAVCYFVNSASEANELALRLARAFTGRTDMIVLDAAYHGHTNALIDLSPYKHAGPGGAGAPEWVHVATLPDDFRGPFRRNDPHRGLHYATPVAEIVHRIHERGRGLAGFIAETCPSVGGQLILPPRYLAEVYRHIRAAGAVRIADEVQTGLGRMGTHFWAFEAQGVVPDVVVMGKPLGNGHPMAAVVTTKEIAAAFDNGMEFFSTFGGNNVSCAVGLAVLDVLRDEDLQGHALRVGERMLGGLRALAKKHEIIGDVRGSGLFIGVELVRDRETLEPAGAEASFVANRMRELGVLLGTDGPFHNVVKIRPPMPFDDANADFLVECLDRILTEDLSLKTENR
jgi:4-aminobutyrate aminotransferase-like enzyme/Ser/Thr protein kinase RdoA (MazF antagonist)